MKIFSLLIILLFVGFLTACQSTIDQVNESINESVSAIQDKFKEATSGQNADKKTKSSNSDKQSVYSRPNLSKWEGSNKSWGGEYIAQWMESDTLVFGLSPNSPSGFILSGQDNKNAVRGSYRIQSRTCETSPKFKVTVRNPIENDIGKFAQSRSVDDLPLATLLKSMTEILLELCEDIESVQVAVRVEGRLPEGVTSNDLYQRNGVLRGTIYDGWLTVGNNWRLTDNAQGAVINIKQRHRIMPNVIMYVKGVCNEQMTALLKKVDDVHGIFSYSQSVRYFASTLKEACPQVKTVDFIIDSLPERYDCRTTNECFINAQYAGVRSLEQAKKDALDSTSISPACVGQLSSLMCPEAELAWDINSLQFGMTALPDPVISTPNDISEIIAAGRFDLLQGYSENFIFYYVGFVEEYSESCKSLLNNPVRVETQLVEQMTDANGFVLSEDRSAPTKAIYVDSAYSQTYIDYSKSLSGFLIKDLIRGWINARRSGNVSGITTGVLSSSARLDSHLESVISNRCNSQEVQTIYENLLHKVNGTRPNTSVFTTDKVVSTPIKYRTGSSAPETEKSLGYDKF